jgi:hypothetical protein
MAVPETKFGNHCSNVCLQIGCLHTETESLSYNGKRIISDKCRRFRQVSGVLKAPVMGALLQHEQIMHRDSTKQQELYVKTAMKHGLAKDTARYSKCSKILMVFFGLNRQRFGEARCLYLQG